MDATTPNAEKLEFTVFRKSDDGKLVYRQLTKKETEDLLKEVEVDTASSGDM